MAKNGFSEIYIDHLAPSVIAVTRRAPRRLDEFTCVAHLAFQPGEAGTPMVTVNVSGKVKEVLLYAEPMSRTCMWMWEVGIGCQNLRCR